MEKGNNNNKMLGKKSQRNNFNNNRRNNNNNKNYKYNNYQNKRNNNYHQRPNNFNNNNNYKNNQNIDSNSEDSNSEKILPIFNKKQEIVDQINKNRVIIVSGNTGCGKSTQVPQFIFEKNKDKKILITQPRRIATISIAKRLSFEMKNKLGELIGYQVSMISHFSNKTKIFVKTTGVFLEELLHNQLDYSYILLDEVHERDLYVDLVLALLKDYFKMFPQSNVKLILMSATIAEDEFAKYLKEVNYNKEVPIVKIKEKWHEVCEFKLKNILKIIEGMNDNTISPILKQKIKEERCNILSMNYEMPVFSESLFPVVAAIIESIENNNSYNKKSGILIFIPGFGEIQDLLDYLTNYFIEANNNNMEFLILHSLISDEEQEKVFINSNKRKIILATNIAESSITISNIDFVIDFCLVKQNRFDEDQNTSLLELRWCSEASCNQRKGRTGRVRKGKYFQLITNELSNKLQKYQVPEILRSPLETPILKLKIYDEKEEPEKILMQTMSPPSQEKIINTIFRLQKMGAIINLEFGAKKEENKMIEEEKEFNEEIKNSNNVIIIKKNNNISENKKKIIYKSGKITNIGRIFADLNVDIKYSRLIIISYVLGQIEVGITLAAILSQERSLFLDSNKVNREKLYESKKFFSLGQNCDFIACYIAYKKWCEKYKKDLVNENIEFDTKLKKINGKRYKEIKDYTRENNLDLKVIKEVIRLENDLKKRLSKSNFYSKYFESIESPLNFKENKTTFILKIILAGAFYDQIFAPRYNDFQLVENDINSNKDGINQKYLYTLIFREIEDDNYKELIEIIENMIKPGQIMDKIYERDFKLLTIRFSDIDCVRKILFVTSPSIRRNNEIPLFTYITKDENSDRQKKIYINLTRSPEYTYSISFYDMNRPGEIDINKDSINLTYVIPNYDELQKTSFVTDSYINKSANNFRKYARYTSVLPRIKTFEKFMALIFGPKYEMVAEEIKSNSKEKKYSHYIGYQSYEFDNYFASDLGNFDNEENQNMVRTNFIKLNYLITNFHLKKINEIRYMINQMIYFRFEAADENEVLSKKEFEEIKKEYDKKTNDILKEIKKLLDCEKIKYINDKRYEMLYDYIQNYNRNHKYWVDNNMIEEEKEDFDENSNAYNGYINEIYEIKSKIKDDDFLQIQEPLMIQDEFYNNNIKIQKKIAKERRIKNIYNEYEKILNDMKSLISSTEAWLVCPNCFQDICAIKPNFPKQTNKDRGEYIIQGSFITTSFKLVQNNKEYQNKKEFEKILEENGLIKGVNYEHLFCCPNEETVIGYMVKGQRYIFKKSGLCVRYPDLKMKSVNEDEYVNNFQNILKKVEEILKYKETDEFKKNFTCKLCDFTVEKKIGEFKKHLHDKFHKENMEELKKEFLC